MGRQKDENIRKIQQSGKEGSYHITLPVRIMRKLKWREGQKVIVKHSGRKIIISDWEK